jgi:hypothetical protein
MPPRRIGLVAKVNDAAKPVGAIRQPDRRTAAQTA